MVSFPRRDEVWLVALDPSRGSEIRKTRPCAIVSPDEMNERLRTVLVAPMTTKLRSYPTRVDITFKNRNGQVALDQMRAVDHQRLIEKLGAIPPKAAQKISSVLTEMFVR